MLAAGASGTKIAGVSPLPGSPIHPTAVVSAEAELSEGVTVGPYAVVESGSVVGEGTAILAHAILTRYATVGAGCEIHYGAVIGHEPQDLSFDGARSRAVIGDRTVVREYATVHRATREGGATTIGVGCLLMAHSHVAHDCKLGNQVVVCNSALVAGHCEIGDRVFLSGNTVVHQFCRVGRLVMLSGTSGIGRDIGPYLMVAGRSEVVALNTVGMRRAGINSAARTRVKLAYRELFGARTLDLGLLAVAAIGREHEEIGAIHDFFSRPSKRGFSRPKAGHPLGDGGDS